MVVVSRTVSSCTSSTSCEKSFTLALLERTALKRPRSKGESVENWVAKTTHLHLEGQELTRIGPLIQKCSHLKNLYCYDNNLEVLDPLPSKVEAIYLDNNLLEEIPVGHLLHLKTLSARNNRLKQIDSLATAPLEELHLSGQEIEISPHVIEGLSLTLRILSLSGCRLKSLDFMCLDSGKLRLTSLDVSDNLIECVDQALPALRLCGCLQRLDVSGNPLCKQAKYRDALIVDIPGPLVQLNGRAIAATEKPFLKAIFARRKSTRV